MTIQDLGSIGEIVAGLATVTTLVYLAIQIRANTSPRQTSYGAADQARVHRPTGLRLRTQVAPAIPGPLLDKALQLTPHRSAQSIRGTVWRRAMAAAERSIRWAAP